MSVRVLLPDGVSSGADPLTPLVVSVPHAGLEVPEEARATLAADEVLLRRDGDLHADRLYVEAARAAGAVVVLTSISRLVADVNRAPDDVDARAVAGHPSPRPEAPLGFVWRAGTQGEPVLSRPLSLAEWRARVERHHRPYYAALAAALGRARERFGCAVLLDGHTMPSRPYAPSGAPGPRRADAVPGDRLGSSCAPRASQIAAATLREHGLRVAPNQPYRGGNITRHFGAPARRVHALQLELRRDLYMDEQTFAVDEAGLARLAAAVRALCERLAAAFR